MRKPGAQLGIIAILAMTGTLACESLNANEYQAAVQKYKADSIAYGVAGSEVADARDVGKLTAAQRAQFVAYQAAVRDADAHVFANLNEWRVSGAKPAAYDADAGVLLAAQMRVIALAAEVRK